MHEYKFEQQANIARVCISECELANEMAEFPWHMIREHVNLRTTYRSLQNHKLEHVFGMHEFVTCMGL